MLGNTMQACYDDDMAAKLDEIAVDLTPEQQASDDDR